MFAFSILIFLFAFSLLPFTLITLFEVFSDPHDLHAEPSFAPRPEFSPYLNAVSMIVAEAQHAIQHVIMSTPSTSRDSPIALVNRQLSRITGVVNTLLDTIDSSWHRSSLLQLEASHLQRLFAGSIVDIQSLNDLLTKRESSERCAKNRADQIMKVDLTWAFYI